MRTIRDVKEDIEELEDKERLLRTKLRTQGPWKETIIEYNEVCMEITQLEILYYLMKHD